jgi:hypothetical protein
MEISRVLWRRDSKLDEKKKANSSVTKSIPPTPAEPPIAAAAAAPRVVSHPAFRDVTPISVAKAEATTKCRTTVSMARCDSWFRKFERIGRI